MRMPTTPDCRHCGKPLLKYTTSWWEAMDKAPEPKVGDKFLFGSRDYTIQKLMQCKGEPGRRRITFWFGLWGLYGNGHFCSKGCGWAWALRHVKGEG